MYKNILIPTDGTEFCEKAVRHGVALAKLAGARVTGVTVTVPFRRFVGMTAPPDILEKIVESRSEAVEKILGLVEAIAGTRQRRWCMPWCSAMRFGATASTRLTISNMRSVERTSMNPAALTFATVSRLICAPQRRRVIGSSQRMRRRSTGCSDNTCSIINSRPRGLSTLRASRSPSTGSGTEQNTKVVTTVSSIAGRRDASAWRREPGQSGHEHSIVGALTQATANADDACHEQSSSSRHWTSSRRLLSTARAFSARGVDGSDRLRRHRPRLRGVGTFRALARHQHRAPIRGGSPLAAKEVISWNRNGLTVCGAQSVAQSSR